LVGLRSGRRSAARFQQRKRRQKPPVNAGIRYVDSPRHLLEVEHFSYRRTLDRLIGELSR
ncbi:MAG: hypothetical protein AAGG46_10355, partial [Planctomycetota bacterium]